MNATLLKKLVQRLSKSRLPFLAKGKPTVTKGAPEGSFEGYPETYSLRYRYECDGSIALSTPKGPLHFNDWMDVWGAITRDLSFVAEPNKVLGSPLSKSKRHLRTLAIILAALGSFMLANELIRNPSKESKPEKTEAVSKSDQIEEEKRAKVETGSASIEVAKAQDQTVRQEGGGPKPDKNRGGIET
jgi:hypothetical protein